MSVSLKTLAEQAGVSLSTVSHVMNGRTDTRIAVKTQEHVRRVALELGYQPNHFARSLAQRKTETIGVIIPMLNNAFFLTLVEFAEAGILEAGYHMLIDHPPFNWDGTPNEHRKLRSWPVDGALIWAYPTQSITEYRQATGLPVVYLGYERSDDENTVAVDHFGGGRLVAEHLIGRGYRKLAHLTPFKEELTRSFEPRFRSFSQICQDAGLPVLYLQTPNGTDTRADGLEAGAAIAAMSPDKRPDAIFCHNDILAIGVHRGLRRAGLRIPEDIAIMGFDGIEEARYLEEPLTTIQFPMEELCQTAMEFLKGQIGGDRTRKQVMMDLSLRVGGTT
jgi:DNA-binding LacI/PurR family transcriptional regulator